MRWGDLGDGVLQGFRMPVFSDERFEVLMGKSASLKNTDDETDSASNRWRETSDRWIFTGCF